MSRARDLSDFISTGALTDGSLDIADVDGLQAAIDDKLDTDGDGSNLTGIDSLPSQSGNADKFLTTNGSAASWGEAGGGASVFLGSYDFTAATTLTIDDFSSTYDTYRIIISGVRAVLNNQALRLYFKTGGTLRDDDYLYNVLELKSSGSSIQYTNSSSYPAIFLTGSTYDLQPDTVGGSYFDIQLYNTNSSSIWTDSSWDAQVTRSSGSHVVLLKGSGSHLTAGTLSEVQFSLGGTETFSGNARIYGIVKE